MKRLLGTIAFLAALAVMTAASAQTTCVPSAPKRWDGEIKVATNGWAAITFFEKNGCVWNGAEGLNGSDGWIADVTGYAGATLTIENTVPVAQHYTPVAGFFLNDKCERSTFWGPTEKNTPLSFGVPPGAKYIYASANVGQTSTTIMIETPGVVCAEEEVVTEEPQEKKKKKKKKKKHH